MIYLFFQPTISILFRNRHSSVSHVRSKVTDWQFYFMNLNSHIIRGRGDNQENGDINMNIAESYQLLMTAGQWVAEFLV